VAPEILDPNLEHGDGYGPEVDLWSVGVILYSSLCGFPPFYSDSDPALIRMIREGEYRFHSPYWDEVSAGAKDLVSNLLVVDPCCRFTCHQSLEHPWIRNAVDASSKKLHRCGARRVGGIPWEGMQGRKSCFLVNLWV
jgi:serine/threonine protein kinase